MMINPDLIVENQKIIELKSTSNQLKASQKFKKSVKH
jgi:hypothetical protein